jgi:hypothetical protein
VLAQDVETMAAIILWVCDAGPGEDRTLILRLGQLRYNFGMGSALAAEP